MTNVSSLTHAISINPANGEQIGHSPFESAPELEASLSRATTGFSTWRSHSVENVRRH
jgi:succinate-semialdehyde dehydrogenase